MFQKYKALEWFVARMNLAKYVAFILLVFKLFLPLFPLSVF